MFIFCITFPESISKNNVTKLYQFTLHSREVDNMPPEFKLTH